MKFSFRRARRKGFFLPGGGRFRWGTAGKGGRDFKETPLALRLEFKRKRSLTDEKGRTLINRGKGEEVGRDAGRGKRFSFENLSQGRGKEDWIERERAALERKKEKEGEAARQKTPGVSNLQVEKKRKEGGQFRPQKS